MELFMFEGMCNNKKNLIPLQELYGRRNVTKTLCNETKSDTKIKINVQTAKQNLQNLKLNLSKNRQRLKSLKYLYTDICTALGIDSKSPSHYGSFNINGVECSIRVSNHNSNANTYEISLNNNISLKIRPKTSHNSFKQSNNVTLEEFVYFDYMLKNDGNLVINIIDSIIDYLDTGEYIDKSGVAKKNYSPDFQTISQQRVQQTLQRKDNEDFINRWHMGENKNYNNFNNNMKRTKKIIRLTESDLHRIVTKSVKKILKEEGKPGSLIHGTHRNEDLIPTFMSEIFRNDPQKAREIWKSSPNLLMALCDQKAGIETNWWDSEEATEICMELQDALGEYAPEGHYFGAHMGDGSDFGYWNDEDEY